VTTRLTPTAAATLLLIGGPALAADWWVINPSTDTCDDAKTRPFTSPAAMRDALQRQGMLRDIREWEDKKTGKLGTVVITTTTDKSTFYFSSKAGCNRTRLAVPAEMREGRKDRLR
jgi:hypothetical protein